MSELLISDKALLNVFKKQYKHIEFSSAFKERLSNWFNFLDTLEEFKSDDFSLFEYVYLSKQYRKKESEVAKKSDIIIPSELWKELLQESIALLKRYDLRENQDLKNNFNKFDPPDIVEISDYYERAVDFEKILYGSDPWYRDHFAHVIRVWLLGLYIIFDLQNKIQSPDFSFYVDIDNALFSMPELFAAYTIAALTHDLGYPLEKLKKLNKKISEILDSFGGVNWSQINASFSFDRYQSASTLLKLLSSKVSFHHASLNGEIRDHKRIGHSIDDFLIMKKEINNIAEYHRFNIDQTANYRIYLRCQWKYHEKYFDSLEGYDHGFLSALLLHRKLVFFKEGEFAIEEDYPFSIEEARQFLIRREILELLQLTLVMVSISWSLFQ